MPVVTLSQIPRVHAAAVSAGLISSRDALLAGIPSDLTGSSSPASSAQLFEDLYYLNLLGRLPDGSVPLLTWLANALALAGPSAEADVFQQVLDLATRSTRIARLAALFPSPAPAPAPAGASQLIFITYGAPDELFAERLDAELRRHGQETALVAFDAVPGHELHLARQGRNKHWLVLICSEKSLDRPGIRDVVKKALTRGARGGGDSYLILVTLDDYEIDDYEIAGWYPPDAGRMLALCGRQVQDFREADADPVKFAEGVARLMAALGNTPDRTLLKRPPLFEVNGRPPWLDPDTRSSWPESVETDNLRMLCCASESRPVKLVSPPEDVVAQAMNQKQGVVSAFASHIVRLATSPLTASRARSVSARLVHEAESGRPWVTVYRPSWILPLRQSSIHIYVLLPQAKKRVLREARAALDAADNPAREAHAIPLRRSVKEGELLVVRVKVPGFEVGNVEAEPWHPPYVRFIVSIRALADVALGCHRPHVTLLSGRGSGELLATLDFDLEVRANNPRALLRRGALGGGVVALAGALVTATERHALSPMVGLSLSAALLAGGASGWMMTRPQMTSPAIHVLNINGSTIGALAVGDHSRARAYSTDPAGARESGPNVDGARGGNNVEAEETDHA